MTRENNHNYLEAFEKLNTAQKEAVTTIDGPVMVLAGPGTGKTQVLGTRIGYILENTDTQAQNILCLTFTDAGVVAMRERLIKFIGKEAYKVNIHTFHSFCNKVIQENPQYFGYRHDIKVASDLQKIEVLNKMIDQIPASDPLKRLRGDIYYDRTLFTELFSQMKREAITAESIERRANYFLEVLPAFSDMYYSRKSGNNQKGDPKEGMFKSYRDKCDKLIAAAKYLVKYDALLKEEGLYDYDDMIGWVVKAFKEHQDLLLDYQEQYLYLLVDEFQDTNGIQMDLLDLMCNFWEEDPNIFVVGDDDQAIYRFQGANVDNLKSFYEKYRPKTVFLTTNYRSRPEVVKASVELISNNTSRLGSAIPGNNKVLIAHKTQEHFNVPVVKSFPNIHQEDAAIIEWLELLIANRIDYKKIAIISRTNGGLENIVNICLKKNIPVYVRSKTNALHIPIVKNLITILRYINSYITDNHASRVYLSEMLQYPSLGLSSFDVLKLMNYSYLLRREQEIYIDTDIRSIMASQNHLVKAGIENPAAFLNLNNKLEDWIGQVQTSTLQVLFEEVLRGSGILQYILEAREKISLLEAVHVIFNFIKEQTATNPDLNLRELIEIWDKMESYNIQIPFVKIVGNAEGIQMMTAHGTKGLEYEYVWIKGANGAGWEAKPARSSSFLFNELFMVERGLLIDKISEKTELNKEVQKEDERRLFFVAVTRAENELVISFAPKSSDKREAYTQFITEIFGDGEIAMKEMSSTDMADYLAITFNETSTTQNELERQYLNRVLERFKMSSTALNNYLNCQLRFYYSNILQMPQARYASTGFGNVAHFVLEKFWKYRKSNGSWPEQSIIQAMVDKYLTEGMEAYKSHFNKVEFENHLIYGKKTLPSFISQQINEWNLIPNFETEYKIDTLLQEIPLTGKLDRVDIFDDYIHVTDYKTGKKTNAETKLRSPKAEDDLGGDYWRQVVFYKILMDLDNRIAKPMISGSMDFIDHKEGEAIQKINFVVSPGEIEKVQEQIKNSFAKIKNHEFYNGCGKTNCDWCKFHHGIRTLDLVMEEDEPDFAITNEANVESD